MLTLAIGDLYIPERTIDIPSKFKRLLCPNPNSVPSNNKISEVVCLGNLTNSYGTLKFLHELSTSFNLVKGEFDNVDILTQQLLALNNTETNIPAYHIITHDNLRIGFTNGYQIVPKNDPLSLSALARELDVDILVWGGTHKVEAYTLDGKFFVNPGSATGAYSFDWPDNEEEDLEEHNEEQGDALSGDKLESEEQSNKDNEDDQGESKSPRENVDKAENKNSEEGVNDEANEANEEDDTSEAVTSKLDSENENQDDKKDNLEFTEDDINEITESISSIPSFCLLDTHGATCVLYIYTYINGEVKVDKVTYQKE